MIGKADEVYGGDKSCGGVRVSHLARQTQSSALSAGQDGASLFHLLLPCTAASSSRGGRSVLLLLGLHSTVLCTVFRHQARPGQPRDVVSRQARQYPTAVMGALSCSTQAQAGCAALLSSP